MTSRQRLRSYASHRLAVLPVRLSTVGRRAFPVSGASTQRPSIAQNFYSSTPSLAVFRQRLKTFLFSHSYPGIVTWLSFSYCICGPSSRVWCRNVHQFLYEIMKYATEILMYEGRPINKIQNGIIQSIFKIWKIRNIGFVRNLIGHKQWNFYEDDVIVVTSRVHRT